MNTIKAKEEFIKGKHNIGYVSSFFLEKFGDSEFEAVTNAPTYQKLPRYMNDAKIESELKPGICTLGDVVAFMDNAPEETKDGNWNLFYTPSFVVFVRWFGDVWHVYAWRRSGLQCRSARRVFSPATDTKIPSSSTCETVTLPDVLTINGVTYKRYED